MSNRVRTVRTRDGVPTFYVLGEDANPVAPGNASPQDLRDILAAAVREHYQPAVRVTIFDLMKAHYV